MPRTARIDWGGRRGWLVVFPNNVAFACQEDPNEYVQGLPGEKNVVAIEFSKPTHWIAMPPQQAVDFAQQLIRYARSIAKEPIRIVIN